MTTRSMGVIGGTLALLAVAPVAGLATAQAQDSVRIAFGYRCDDRFTVKNESDASLDFSYDVVNGPESGRLHLEPGESTDIVPSTLGEVRLLLDGKVIATARNEQRGCDRGGRTVVVRPMYADGPPVVVDPYYGGGYYGAAPLPVVIVRRPYYAPSPIGIYAGISFGRPIFRAPIVRVPVFGRPYGYERRGYREENRENREYREHRGRDRDSYRDNRDSGRGDRGNSGDRTAHRR